MKIENISLLSFRIGYHFSIFSFYPLRVIPIFIYFLLSCKLTLDV